MKISRRLRFHSNDRLPFPFVPADFHSEKIMAVFTLEDEQIVWTDKSCDGLFDYCEFKMANSANFQANFPQIMAPFAYSISPRRLNRPFVRLSPSECEFRSDFVRPVRLDGQIVFKKSSS